MGWLIAPWSQPSYDHSVGLGVEPTFTSGTSRTFNLSNFKCCCDVSLMFFKHRHTSTPCLLFGYCAQSLPCSPLPFSNIWSSLAHQIIHYTMLLFLDVHEVTRNLCAPCFYLPLFSELCFKVHVHFLSHAIYVALKLCTEEVCSASWYMNAE